MVGAILDAYLQSRRSTRAFGSSASRTMILDTSTWSRKPCNPSTTRSARGCHPCLRYVLLPMSPGRTNDLLAEGEELGSNLLRVTQSSPGRRLRRDQVPLGSRLTS